MSLACRPSTLKAARAPRWGCCCGVGPSRRSPSPEQQPHRGALAAFHVEGLHANDIAALLDSAGICIRSGHHCTQPLHRHYGLSGTARASLGFTTTPEEIDRFAEELVGTIQFLREHS